jgi:DnaJ-domain-containing protein 1
LFPSSNTGSNAVASHDVMAAFYLDLDNIDAMSDKQIHDMLGGFWQRYFAKDERQSALAELNLGPDADYDDIRSRYRELAREHHPDRGGEHDRFQRINRAMETLKKYYGK